MSDRVIWMRTRGYYTKQCTWQDVDEGDCLHPTGWHRTFWRVRCNEYNRYVFETIRRRKDKGPGAEWTPMTRREIKEIREEWANERFGQLCRNPEIEDV